MLGQENNFEPVKDDLTEIIRDWLEENTTLSDHEVEEIVDGLPDELYPYVRGLLDIPGESVFEVPEDDT